MNPLFDLSGRTALITGSSQAIGFALARGLAQAGAAVVLNGRDAAKRGVAADALRAELSSARVVTAAFDVTDAAVIGREAGKIINTCSEMSEVMMRTRNSIAAKLRPASLANVNAAAPSWSNPC